MNFEIQTFRKPIRVLVANATCQSAQALTLKIMIGAVFSRSEQVNLILLVYDDELSQAEGIKNSINSCTIRYVNSVVVTSLMPRITDADVFFFVTNFSNPNHLDFTIKLQTCDFDSIYLILKIAHNFSKYPPLHKGDDGEYIDDTGRGKPIFICNGLIPMDILKTFSKNIDDDSIFSPSWLENISRNILASYLKVRCTDINKIYAFAADDKQFYIEIERPVLNADRIVQQDGFSNIPWDGMSQKMYKILKLDRMQFNESWLKSELFTKMVGAAKLNSYGSIFKATEIAKMITVIWSARVKTLERSYRCLGVISDGSMGTIKGLPYVLPIVFYGNSWSVDGPASLGLSDGPRAPNTVPTSIMLKQAIKRINITAQRNHEELIPFCKKFLLNNVLKQEFLTSSDSSIRLVKISSHSLATANMSDDASDDSFGYVPLTRGLSSMGHF